ncbi:hypothetical protein [Actinobacillus equuli]|uniref:Uncharacterized protein n=1 Tax=Actinobacillus equuli TaxID=718 RepID=A0AAX3FM39_ACTEU|nr:hypothetical protein [Actinobacillus equuli]AIZ78756.1 hypothetical protein ACEE_02975 [Actinobacillus equuli subsp. equuli]WGE45014.1 hypothetical protein NYR65_02945 [Actinobacillus equuli subsp. equuli]VEE92979.1 Uncharacterised protein [Actinobacillus equuli]
MKVTLNIGIDYNGKIIRDCTVQFLTMGGQCTAQEMIADLCISEDEEALSQREKTLIEMAYLSQQVEFDGIPHCDVDAEFLLDNLTTDDYWQLVEATLELRKKRLENGVSQSEIKSLLNPDLA